MRENGVNSAADWAGCEKLGFGSDLRCKLIDVFRKARATASIHQIAKHALAIPRASLRSLARIIERGGKSGGQRVHVVDRVAHVAPDPLQALPIEMDRVKAFWIVDQHEGAIERKKFELNA